MVKRTDGELVTRSSWWIEYMIDSNLNARPFSKLNLNSKPAYSSCYEALVDLRSLSGVEALGFHDIVFWVSQKEPAFDGDPYLIAIEQDDDNPEACIYGYLNLISGEWGIVENACSEIN